MQTMLETHQRNHETKVSQTNQNYSTLCCLQIMETLEATT